MKIIKSIWGHFLMGLLVVVGVAGVICVVLLMIKGMNLFLYGTLAVRWIMGIIGGAVITTALGYIIDIGDNDNSIGYDR